MSSQEEKTNRINTLILRKIADKFKIPHENLPILAISEKKSSDKYLQAYKTFFEKIFKPDDILKPVSPSDTELNLIDIIKNLFSGTIGTPISIINTPSVESVSGLSSTSTGTSMNNSLLVNERQSPNSIDTLTDNSVSGTESQSFVSTLTDNSVSGNRTLDSISVGTSTEIAPTVDETQPVTVNTKTSTPDTGDNVVIETKFNKEKSTKYLNYDKNNKKIIMTDKPKKSL
jgi:hypothetical protein